MGIERQYEYDKKVPGANNDINMNNTITVIILLVTVI
jgi:hypothetical protein